ncbi:hypothetical protein B0H14DRAFT_3156459 [Mycena olivaceomarginata]|nr:hypothetical protein B0H14DRAFT_3156459 [Mycena olivaceomarginata]
MHDPGLQRSADMDADMPYQYSRAPGVRSADGSGQGRWGARGPGVGEGRMRRARLRDEMKRRRCAPVRRTWGRVCVCAGGSAVPAQRGFRETAGELRERPGRRGTKRGTGPNPYAKAATGPEERDPEQPYKQFSTISCQERTRRLEQPSVSRKRRWVGGLAKRVDVGRGTLDARSDVEGRANGFDVAMPIRLGDLVRDDTTTYGGVPTPPRFSTVAPLSCLPLRRLASSPA